MHRIVLITGASRGIGAATALRFAKNQDIPIINYLHSEEKAFHLKEKIKQEYGIEAMTVQADIRDEKQVQEMVQKIMQTYGRIDILVNNAGIAIDDEFFDHTVSNFQKVMNTNLIGTFLVSKYVSTPMLEAKNGVIINISSNNGIDCNSPISLDYDASKAAILSLTKNLAIALAPFIRVNTVAPGWTKTDSVLEMFPDFLEEERKKILLGRFAEPDEIANVIFFLASEEAKYINSEIIRVDGGIYG